MVSITTYFYCLTFFLLHCYLNSLSKPDRDRTAAARNRPAFSPLVEGQRGLDPHTHYYYSLENRPAVVLFCISALPLCHQVPAGQRENTGLHRAVFSERDRYLASPPLIVLIFFLSRICLCWRITTGDLRSACFENQDFWLTCQRK